MSLKPRTTVDMVPRTGHPSEDGTLPDNPMILLAISSPNVPASLLTIGQAGENDNG